MTIGMASGVKSNAEKVGDVAFEGGGDSCTEFLFELLFNEVGGTEVDEIIYVQADVEWWMAFDDSAVKDTRGVLNWFETNGEENFSCFFIPVTRGALEAV